MDNASSIAERLHALKVLHENGIYMVLFMSPIFPEITDYREIIELSRSFVDEYWFENLNLRGSYKGKILKYINEKSPKYANLYEQIYIHGNKEYWDDLVAEIEGYCGENGIRYVNFFGHEKLVEEKRGR